MRREPVAKPHCRKRGAAKYWAGSIEVKRVLSFFVLVFFAAQPLAAQVSAAAWPEADRLFRSDPLWLGADAAYSVDLGHGRVLWLFGDSFIASAPGQTRKQAAFVHNSVAIQPGYDPSHASIRFYTGRKADGGAASYFAEDGAEWFWPMQGVRLGKRLLIFAMRESRNPDSQSLGFRATGWNAFLIGNPDAEPSQWNLRRLTGPQARGRLLAGAAALRADGFLYAYAVDDATHDAWLMRWTAGEASAGKLMKARWWCGAEHGWRADAKLRKTVMTGAETEFSVQRDPRGGWLLVESDGFGASPLALRHAERLEGPWSDAESVYRPPESDRPQALVYAGKGHPELRGADVVATYAANGPDARLTTDMTIYFPRFVRITLSPR